MLIRQPQTKGVLDTIRFKSPEKSEVGVSSHSFQAKLAHLPILQIPLSEVNCRKEEHRAPSSCGPSSCFLSCTTLSTQLQSDPGPQAWSFTPPHTQTQILHFPSLAFLILAFNCITHKSFLAQQSLTLESHSNIPLRHLYICATF